MSTAMRPIVMSIVSWIRDKKSMERSMGLGLCPPKSMQRWKIKRMLLAEIPILTSENRVIFRIVLVWSVLALFIIGG